MSKEQQPRVDIERDITDKIWAGDIATLHLPARDVHVFYQLVKGEDNGDFDTNHRHISSMSRSLQYLRDAFKVGTTDQAFGMLVARGFPLPDDLIPHCNPVTIKFSQKQLDVVKLWVEGKLQKQIATDLLLSEGGVKSYFGRMRSKVDAKSNIQLVVAVIKEGFLQPHRQEDGTFIFETEEHPHPKLNPRQKKILVDRFHNIPENYIGDELGIYCTTVQQGVAKARKKFKVNTTPQLVLRCLELGELDIDELTEAFDLERAKTIRNTYQVLLEKSLEGGGKYESNRQIGKVVGLTHDSVQTYKHRIIEALGVKTYLQAMIVYKAAVERGIIPPYEETERQNGHNRVLPQSAVIFTPDQQ